MIQCDSQPNEEQKRQLASDLTEVVADVPKVFL